MYHHQAKDKRHFAILLVVIMGWALESITFYAIKPTAPYGPNDYTMFWLSATQLRNVLFIFSALMLYSVRGSILIFILMGFNLFAIGMNIMYLDPSNYPLISPFRKEFFGPAYRVAELTITTWALWHVRTKIYNSLVLFLRRRHVVGDLWNILNKGSHK